MTIVTLYTMCVINNLFENIFMVTQFFTQIAMCVIYLCKIDEYSSIII